MKQELAESVWKIGVSSLRGVCSRQRALETPRLTREALGTAGSSGLGAAGQHRLSGSFGYLDIGNHKENLVL